MMDEVGTCPNIEIEVDMLDKIPFFIRSYHVKEEDKQILYKDMKRLYHLVGMFAAYSSQVMLLNRKLTKDKSSTL